MRCRCNDELCFLSGHLHQGKKGKELGQAVRLFFPVLISHPDDHLRETSVQSAFLKIFISKFHSTSPSGPQPNSRVVLQAYQLLEDHTKAAAAGRLPRKRLLDSMFVHVDHTGWVKFNIKQAAVDWHKDPASNHGIEIQTEDYNLPEILTIVTSRSKDKNHTPTVTVYTKEESILGRSKREADFNEPFNCRQGDSESRCCRYPLMVSFREIGWDWVIAPDSFQAYYCDGSCPYRFRAAHRFSSVQSILHMLNPLSVPSPSCTPQDLSPLELLHATKNGGLAVTRVNQMVVGNCGCA